MLQLSQCDFYHIYLFIPYLNYIVNGPNMLFLSYSKDRRRGQFKEEIRLQ